MQLWRASHFGISGIMSAECTDEADRTPTCFSAAVIAFHSLAIDFEDSETFVPLYAPEAYFSVKNVTQADTGRFGRRSSSIRWV